jgi:uncharacterized protein YkwD
LPRPKPLLAAVAAGIALAAAPAAVAVPTSTTETAVLRAVNAARTAHGLHAVRLDIHLRSAARAHSNEMLRGDYFAHGDVGVRLAAFGVTTSFAGENLAWGTGSMGTAHTIVAEWLASPGHRANLLRPGFVRIGVGVAQGTFHGYAGAVLVTADFAG